MRSTLLLVVSAWVLYGCGGGHRPLDAGEDTEPDAVPDGEDARPDADVDGDAAAPSIAVSGTVLDFETGDPVAGAVVAVRGAAPAIEATTAPDGTFELEVPTAGVHTLRASVPFYWGTLAGIVVPEGGLSDVSITLYSEDMVDDFNASLDEPIDEALGVMAIAFDTPSNEGGEYGVPSEDEHGDPFVFNSGIAVASPRLVAGGVPTLFFPNVAASSVAADIHGAQDLTTCELAITDMLLWPVDARFFTQIAATCAEADPPPTVTVEGTIDDESGSPVEGATVAIISVLSDASTTSDSAGHFAMMIPAGIRLIRVALTGYWGELRAFDVPETGRDDLVLTVTHTSTVEDLLEPLGYSPDDTTGAVQVTFKDASASGGESASITATSLPPYVVDSESGLAESSSSLLDGSEDYIVFPNAVPGTTEVDVSPAEDINTCALVEPGIEWPILAQTLTTVEAECTLANVSVTGTVTDWATGSPISGASIEVRGYSPPVVATTGSDGTFTLMGTPHGEYFLRASKGGYWHQMIVVDIPEAGLSGADFVMFSDAAVSDPGGFTTDVGAALSTSKGMIAFHYNSRGSTGGEFGEVYDPTTYPTDDMPFAVPEPLNPSAPVFTIDADGHGFSYYVVLPDGDDYLFFANLDVGEAAVAVIGADRVTTCELDRGTDDTDHVDWPLLGKTITQVDVVCVDDPDGTDLVTLTGQVFDSEGGGLADATVEFSSPRIRALSDESGNYEATVPAGTHVISVLATDYWSWFGPASVPSGGSPTQDFEMIARATTDSWGTTLGREFLEGMVSIDFATDNTMGGETASISGLSSMGPFTIDGSDTPVASTVLLDGGRHSLLYDNVATGNATLGGIAGASGINDCEATIPTLVNHLVIPSTVTHIPITCTPL